MKKGLQLILACIFFHFCFLSHAQNVWNQKANFSGSGRHFAVGFSIGNFGFIGTGQDSTGLRKDFWKWDQTLNAWTQIADFGGSARYKAVSFSIGNKGYLGTGTDSNGFTQDFWEYDLGGNNWTVKSNFGGGVRDWAVGFSINGKGYFGTGQNGSGYTQDFWEYDPIGDSWTQKTNFQGGVRYGATGLSIGNKGYIGLGSDSFTPNKQFWEYDPLLDTWTQKTDFGGIERAYAVGFSINGKGYVGTGLDASMPPPYANDLWEYNPANDSWLQVANFGDSAVSDAMSFSIGSKGYVGTGRTVYGYENFFWEYSPPVGIMEYVQVADVNVYPNPTNSILTVEFLNPNFFTTVKISVINIFGEIINEQDSLPSSSTSLDFSNLNSGIYFLSIESKHLTFIKKIIKN